VVPLMHLVAAVIGVDLCQVALVVVLLRMSISTPSCRS
jgi:hypothetical protein